LMGSDRDAKPEERRVRKFTDSDICRNYLIGLCPHDLFKNTKMDLGACSAHHNEHLKEVFDADAEAERYKRKWRGNLRIKLKRVLEDVDRRIGLNKERIAKEKDGALGMPEEQKQQLAALREDVSEKLRRAERAADDGKFDESRDIIRDTEATKRRIEDLEQRRFEKYKKDNICEVCGLIIDGEEVEAMKTGRGWHSNGKQHIGYKLVRDKLKEIEGDQARDRGNGVPTPSPSPIRPVQKPDVRRRPSLSPARAQKTEARKRRGSPSRSPKRSERGRRTRSLSKSPVRGSRAAEDKKRRAKSKSRSKGRARSKSRSKGRAKDEKRPKPSRSRSPAKKSSGTKRSRSRRKKCSRSRDAKHQKRAHSSPRRRSRSSEGEKDRKAKKAAKEGPDVTKKDPVVEAKVDIVKDQPAPEKPKPPAPKPEREQAETAKEEPKPPEPEIEVPRPPVAFFLGFKRPF